MTKELHLIDELIHHPEISQRQLAKCLDISLGSVNNMINGLEKKHLVEMNHIRSRKVQYVVTQAGLAYRNTLLYDYINQSFGVVTDTRYKIKTLLENEIKSGVTCFYLDKDEDDFFKIVKMSLMELSRVYQIDYFFEEGPSELADHERYLIWKDPVGKKRKNIVHLLKGL